MSDQLLRRKGRFLVASSIARERIGQGLPLLPNGTAVVRCEHHFDRDALEYCGYHAAFAVVPDGEEAPFYEIRVNRLGDGSEIVYFVV